MRALLRNHADFRASLQVLMKDYFPEQQMQVNLINTTYDLGIVSELVKVAQISNGLTKKDAETAINAVFGAIGDALAKGDAVQLIGFGTFGVKERAAREGRNPRTGEVVKIKASKVPTFKAGKALKDKVAK